MNNTKRKIAVVGVFFDGYSDLWEDFLSLKEKFWKHCKYPFYIVNNSKAVSIDMYSSVHVLHAGDDAEYSRKVQMVVNEIDADYFLLLLDDFFFSGELPAGFLDSIVNYMESNDICYYEMPMPGFRSLFTHEAIKPLSSSSGYTVTCMPAIWSKDFLCRCIGQGNYNAWVFEGIYEKAKAAHKKNFLQKCVIDYSNPLHLCHGALQGKILPAAYNELKKKQYILKTDRAVMSMSSEIKFKIKSILRHLIPYRWLPFFRKILHSTSVLDRYSDQISFQIMEMGLDE